MKGLPRGCSFRPSGPDDAVEVAGLMAACFGADGGAEGTSVEHVLDDRHEIDLGKEAALALGPDGDVAGYADAINRAFVSASVYCYVHPEHRGWGLGASLVGWGDDWTRGRMRLAPSDARVVVKHYVISTNTGARRLLENAGYEAVRGTYVMEIHPEGVTAGAGVAGGAGGEDLRPRPGRAGGLLGGRGRLPGRVGPDRGDARALRRHDAERELRFLAVVSGDGGEGGSGRRLLQDGSG